MEVTLKVQRWNPDTEEGRIDEFTVDVPETATLLDTLDAVKDYVDGSLTYRKSCRMAICGSCGMRMDGAAVLACKTPMLPLVEEGRVPLISPMGNLPVLKDLAVDMGPFWAKIRAIKPYLEDADAPVPSREWRVQQAQLDRVQKEALCIMCGCCVSECNSMEADPEFLGPAALAKAARFVGDVRDRDTRNRLELVNGPHGVWDCTRCYFCNERCPKGVDPRDAIAKLGAEIYSEGMLSDKGARHARVFDKSTYQAGYLLETQLVPETLGPVGAVTSIPLALRLAKAGKVPNPLRPHKARKLDEVRRLHKLIADQERAELEEEQEPLWPSDGSHEGSEDGR